MNCYAISNYLIYFKKIYQKGSIIKAAVMQPYFFPYLGYWHLLDAVDTFVMFDDVNYIKKGYINRNSILVNDAPKLITLSLVAASQNKKIKELSLASNAGEILKTIELVYLKSLNFELVFPELLKIFKNPAPLLIDFLEESILTVNSLLKIDAKIFRSSQFNLSVQGKDKIIPLCKALGAETYINPIGGVKLYDKGNFKINGIDLKFIKSDFFKYPQNSNLFHEKLSVVDFLMNVPVTDWRMHLSAYREI